MSETAFSRAYTDLDNFLLCKTGANGFAQTSSVVTIKYYITSTRVCQRIFPKNNETFWIYPHFSKKEGIVIHNTLFDAYHVSSFTKRFLFLLDLELDL